MNVLAHESNYVLDVGSSSIGPGLMIFVQVHGFKTGVSSRFIAKLAVSYKLPV
jgi:hypothetical protein